MLLGIHESPRSTAVANSRGPASLADLARETGARAVAVNEAVRDRVLVIVTIPEKRIPELPKRLLERGTPAGTPGHIPLPVAGDDAAARQLVMRLIDELGFDAVDAGELDESWRRQPGSPVYGTDVDAEGVRRALAQASSTRPRGFRVHSAGDARA